MIWYINHIFLLSICKGAFGILGLVWFIYLLLFKIFEGLGLFLDEARSLDRFLCLNCSCFYSISFMFLIAIYFFLSALILWLFFSFYLYFWIYSTNFCLSSAFFFLNSSIWCFLLICSSTLTFCRAFYFYCLA